MILVDVGRGRKRTRKTLLHVMFLKKGASAFRGSEVAQTHMGRAREKHIHHWHKEKRAPQMSSETMSGKDFMSKQTLVFIASGIFWRTGASSTDSAPVLWKWHWHGCCTFPVKLQDTKYVHPKTPQEITRKVVSFLTENEVFKTIFKEQIWLNWFR